MTKTHFSDKSGYVLCRVCNEGKFSYSDMPQNRIYFAPCPVCHTYYSVTFDEFMPVLMRLGEGVPTQKEEKCKHPIANVYLQEDGNIHCGGCKKVWEPKDTCLCCSTNWRDCNCKLAQESWKDECGCPYTTCKGCIVAAERKKGCRCKCHILIEVCEYFSSEGRTRCSPPCKICEKASLPVGEELEWREAVLDLIGNVQLYAYHYKGKNYPSNKVVTMLDNLREKFL